MRLDMDLNALRAFLDNDEDSSLISPNEYIVDLYDAARPLTLDLRLENGGVTVIAAALLKYDEELDGWYMDSQVSDEEEIRAALVSRLG